MVIVQEYQCHYINDHHIAMPEFPLGSEAYVHAEYFCIMHLSKKLVDELTSPFKVITHPGSHSYNLHLPKNMCLVHPVFHVAMLSV